MVYFAANNTLLIITTIKQPTQPSSLTHVNAVYVCGWLTFVNIRKQGLCKPGRAYSVWSLLFMPQISSLRELFSGQLNKNSFRFEYVKVN